MDDSKVIGFLGGGFGEPPVRVTDLELAAARRRRVDDMRDINICQVQTAIGDHEAALTLARSAVEERLAACAQVSGPIWSIYRWQEVVQEAEEWLVTFKTRVALYPVLESFINEHHSYDVPEILCMPVTQGNPDYLKWVAETTSKG